MTDVITKYVAHWGIHTDMDGVKHLVQPTNPRGYNYAGLPGYQPINSRAARDLDTSSHEIVCTLGDRNPSQKMWDTFLPLLDDPIVQAMLPVPEGPKASFVDIDTLEERTLDFMHLLERLNSPLHSWVKPLWMVTEKQVGKALQLTNIHPVVLYDVTDDDTQKVNRLVQLARTSPRRLILVGSASILDPSVKRLKPTQLQHAEYTEMVSMPLEHLGATVVRRYCQGVPYEKELGRVPEHRRK